MLCAGSLPIISIGDSSTGCTMSGFGTAYWPGTAWKEIAGTEFYDGILILVPIPALDAGVKENKRCHQDSYSDTSFVIPSQAREQGTFDMLPGEQLADALERQGFTGIAEAGSPVCVLLLTRIPCNGRSAQIMAVATSYIFEL